jgi:hypothetical protein
LVGCEELLKIGFSQSPLSKNGCSGDHQTERVFSQKMADRQGLSQKDPTSTFVAQKYIGPAKKFQRSLVRVVGPGRSLVELLAFVRNGRTMATKV